MIAWLTGLPCSGKTTLGRAVTARLKNAGSKAQFLDGDEVRKWLWPELGFSHSDREENIHRFGLLAGILSHHGIVAIVSAVSPYRASRDLVRRNSWQFIEVFVNAPLNVCELRDVKGMYRKARAGEIPDFTGVSDPYEPPLHPELECRTDLETIDESVSKIMDRIQKEKLNAQDHRPSRNGQDFQDGAPPSDRARPAFPIPQLRETEFAGPT